LNSFIITIIDGAALGGQAVVASAILVTRKKSFACSDWSPFAKKVKLYEQARIPSNVLFVGIECHDTFSGLLDLVKSSAVRVPGSQDKD
jgi:hypothetical protein